MDVRQLTHRPGDGWSTPLPSALDSARTLVVVFAATPYADRTGFWTSLLDAFPHSAVLACSSAGGIAGRDVVDDAAVMAVVRFDRVTLTRAAVPIQAIEMSKRAGEKLGKALADPHPSAVLVLSDGLHVRGSDLLQGLAESLPAGTTVVGGLAGDGQRFQRTWTLVDGVPRSGWVTAVGLSGPVEVRTSHGSGWQAFGPERRVTRAEHNVLFELDGRPALQLYKDYLGDLAAGLPATALRYPLALRTDGEPGEGMVRTVLGIDEATQSMTFAGDVPEGARARLMRAGHERLIEGATQAGLEVSARESPSVLALAISCVGRRMVLGERCEDETEATLGAMPAGSTQVGFYAYGEIGPSGTHACRLHNQTMTLATLREVAA